MRTWLKEPALAFFLEQGSVVTCWEHTRLSQGICERVLSDARWTGVRGSRADVYQRRHGVVAQLRKGLTVGPVLPNTDTRQCGIRTEPLRAACNTESTRSLGRCLTRDKHSRRRR